MSVRRQKSIRDRLVSTFAYQRERNALKYTTKIKDYELISPLGGVDDISYLYLSRFQGTFVALKYTDLTICSNYALLEDLITSIRNSMSLRHPNILPYYKCFVENERLWIVTIPMRLGSCRHILNKEYKAGLPEVVVATILREILKALEYLHSDEICHNDLRCENILIDITGEVCLTGLHHMRKKCFDFVGEVEWASPEVLDQHTLHGTASDIYSFGATAVELAFGRTGFENWPALKVFSIYLDIEGQIKLCFTTTNA
eukprot:NODE_67_length_25542_cov_1.476831.p11 type:complete len:258 gc:universal NODE_67_length_25542_cov_1.476831:11397-10624(-)